MHTCPEVSIIVPTHNSRAFVIATLESIRSQSFQNWECVIVDDGSRDGTPIEVSKIVEEDRRFRLFCQSCGGASLARNRGFMESSPLARFVVFMDSDDIWSSDALSSLLDSVRESPNAIGAHGLAELIDEKGRGLSPGTFSDFGRSRLGYSEGAIKLWPRHEPTVFETLVWTGPLYPPGLLLVRREVYEKVGLYDKSLRQCEDWDMCLRLSREGPIKFLDRVLLHYRRHGGNLSNDVRGNRKAVRRLHFKTFFSKENTPEQSAMLRTGWRAWQCYKMGEKWRAVKKAFTGGEPLTALRTIIEVPVHVLRYLRGYPSRIGL